jgi:uncharacterized membrane protein YfcA
MISVSLTTWEITILVGCALLICTLSTSMAMESASLFVPAFMLFFPSVLPRFPSLGVNDAIGLTLIVMFFGQTSANVSYWFRGQTDVSLAGRVLIWTIPLSIIGRLVSYVVPEGLLLLVFASLLVGLSGVVYRHATAEHRDSPIAVVPRESRGGAGGESRVRLRLPERVAMGVGGGFTGLVGLGMGEVCNTILTARSRMSVHRSVGTATLVLYLTVLSAAITNLVLVRFGEVIGIVPSIPWTFAAILSPVALIGGLIGPSVNRLLSERAIMRLLPVLYLGVAIITVIRAFG